MLITIGRVDTSNKKRILNLRIMFNYWWIAPLTPSEHYVRIHLLVCEVFSSYLLAVPAWYPVRRRWLLLPSQTFMTNSWDWNLAQAKEVAIDGRVNIGGRERGLLHEGWKKGPASQPAGRQRHATHYINFKFLLCKHVVCKYLWKHLWKIVARKEKSTVIMTTWPMLYIN
jgi:hypothetical protein